MTEKKENFFKKAFRDMKESAKKSWEDAKMNPSERQAKIREEQLKQIELAKARTAAANEKYEKVKVKK